MMNIILENMSIILENEMDEGKKLRSIIPNGLQDTLFICVQTPPLFYENFSNIM